jgi:type I restriction enzyme M protein
MLRISTILESWGDLEIAREHIATEKARLWALIQEDLGYKLLEIEEHYQQDIETLTERVDKVKKSITEKEGEGKKPTKSEIKNLETANTALEKLLNQKADKILAAHEQAAKERKAIDEVELELMTMLQDPELRKRYFSVVGIEELEENEFNLNIPRYVDTFEPEEEIDLKEAIESFKNILKKEEKSNIALQDILKLISNA